MRLLFEEDQAERRALGAGVTLEELSEADSRRRHEVLGYLTTPSLYSADDFYFAAMIFHHGACTDHYELANELAALALDLGNPNAPWLYASTMDRYLRSLGKPQRFGTQYVARGRCNYVLAPVERATTDEERLRYGVPMLADARAMAVELSNECRR